MLDNSIRGGQIFIHQIRMFKQVAGYAFFVAFFGGLIAALYFSQERFMSIDWYPALTYWRGFIIDKFDNIVPNLNNTNHQIMINISKDFAKPHFILIKEFMKMSYFAAHGERLLYLVLIFLLYASLTGLGAFLLIFWSWEKFGKFAKEVKLLQGNRIHTAKDVITYLKINNMASDLCIGDVPLVKDSETKHILITGSTGSGKTNCLHLLLPQIRTRGQPAIVVDTEGTMVERYYRPGKDIILNPFDIRSHAWDFWQEINNDRLVESVANSFFPETPNDSYSGDRRWNSWGKMLFLGAIEYLKKSNNKSIEALFDLLHKEQLEVMTNKLKETSISGLLDSKNEYNSAPHNIRMNTMEATKWLKYFTTAREQSLCFRNWFNELDQKKDDRWIFITCDSQMADSLLPFIATVMDIALSSLIALKANNKRRVWFIMDELAKLKYLPTLEKNITLLRKYGGCVLAATQTFKQLFVHYGKNSGSIMLGQFNTNIIFKITDSDDASIIAKRVGNIEILAQQKNTSYGAHEYRDGISYTEQPKSRVLIETSDLANLKPGEAYMLLPEPNVAISKIKTKTSKQQANKDSQPDFVFDSNIEKSLRDEESTLGVQQLQSILE